MKKILLIALLSTSYSFSQCFVKIVSGEQHTIAIADDGTLWGWGSNSSGECGIPSTPQVHIYEPTQIGTASNWVDAECGSYHTLALDASGNVYTWGYNNNGQLGLSDNSNRTSPTLAATGASAIGAGTYNSFIVFTDGTLFGAGFGGDGQFGDGLSNDYSSFTQIASGNDWKDATGGSAFSLALKTNGTLYAAGYNGNGEFGNGNTNASTVWTATATGITNWDKIDAGFDFAFGLTDAGFLYSWGGNFFGQLGQNGSTGQVDPQPVSTNVVDFGCGYQSSIWMTSTAVYSAGKNAYNQSKPGNTADVTTPHQWANFSAPEAVSMGIFGSTVIDDSKLYTWGRNDRGYCANNSSVNVTSPAVIFDCANLGIEENNSTVMNVYPNPTNNVLNIQLSAPSSVVITDINGKQIIASEKQNAHIINVSNLESGIYFVITQDGTTQRFIKN